MAFYFSSAVDQETACYHCGDPLGAESIRHRDKAFCCNGCRVVYELLAENNLCAYYSRDTAPGRTPREPDGTRYLYLDDPAIAAGLLDFSDGSLNAVTLSVPSMHCSSCVWLLERLGTLEPGIIQSRVDFLRKLIHIRFTTGTTLRRIVELLTSLGYEPDISLASTDRATSPSTARSLYYRVGIAGFCFANIMLFSFPDYLSGGEVEGWLQRFFSYLSLVLALPVIVYAASPFTLSAWAGLRRRIVNIDVPIALGILIQFARSVYEILAGIGPGYLDSMSGLVFFLLIGRLFQARTYDNLNFERTYRSYFPLAVTVRKGKAEAPVPVESLTVGDRMVIRNGDVVPADAILVRGNAEIDYSFVTGESRPVPVSPGQRVLAGGRQQGAAIELDVVREVSHSYLTQLWSEHNPLATGERRFATLSNAVGKYFTAGVLVLAALAAAFWLPRDPGVALDAVTAVLIVACPCAIALATPFTFGSILRVCGRNRLYLKNADLVEALARVDTVVFDKTGTVSYAGHGRIRFEGGWLSTEELAAVGRVVRNSSHPLSRALAAAIGGTGEGGIREYMEVTGGGVAGTVDGLRVRVGSARFVSEESSAETAVQGGVEGTRVYVALDGTVRGWFALAAVYREGVADMVRRLKQRYRLFLLSGDNAAERDVLTKRFGGGMELQFEQSPADKLAFVRGLQARGRHLMMVGDGLNDAAALRESNVGVSVVENTGAFSPASDAILEGSSLRRLDEMLWLARAGMRVVWVSIGLSLVYNVAGLTFAVAGQLSPLVAAILMPLSSVTVVAWTTLGVRAAARRKGLL